MRPVHFYHAYVEGNWRACVAEHRDALALSGFVGDCYVSLIGSPEHRAEARRLLPGFTVAVEADEGFEQRTLADLHACAQVLPFLTPVLYAHTKGGWQTGASQDLWRRCMTQNCIYNWRECVKLLNEHDTAGIHLTRAVGPEFRPLVYAGNFWWANAGYLAGLPPVTAECPGHHGPCPSPRACRWAAEAWIGQNHRDAYGFSGLEAERPVHPHELAEPMATARPVPTIGLVSRVAGESGVNQMRLRLSPENRGKTARNRLKPPDSSRGLIALPAHFQRPIEPCVPPGAELRADAPVASSERHAAKFAQKHSSPAATGKTSRPGEAV